MNLHWFDVTLDTPMRQIGWVWVILALAVCGVAYGIGWLWHDWRDLLRGEGDYAPDRRPEP